MFAFTNLQAQSVAQHYARGKPFLTNGMTLEGDNLRMNTDSVTLEIMKADQVYQLANIVQIMAKQGKETRYSRNCVGSCVGVYLGLWPASGGQGADEEGNRYSLDPGKYLIEMAL